MIKIEIITSGPDKFKPGQIIRVDCAWAYALIESGRAKPFITAKATSADISQKITTSKTKKKKSPSLEVK